MSPSNCLAVRGASVRGNYETAVAGSGTVSAQVLNNYSSKAPGEIVVYEPDHLTVAQLELETVPYHDGVHVIEAEATTVVETWYLQIKVEGLEYVSSAEAFLSGMAGSTGISDSVDGEEDNTVYFTLRKGDDDGVPVICNIFNTFGRLPDSRNHLKVTFDIRTVDGRNETREFDITDLFSTEAALEHNWLLMEETITIDPPAPPEPGEGGGFQPGVDDWEDEDHDIVI